MKKRILFIIDFIYGTTGGTENQLLKLLDHLDHEKYELHLLSLSTTPWLMENGRALNCSLLTFNYNIFNHKDIRNVVEIARIVRRIRHIKPDIALCFFKTSYVLGVIAARIAGVKNIISTRRDYGLWLDKGFVYPLKVANKFVKAIITNSHKVKELTASEEGFDISRIHVIYNGMNMDGGASPDDGNRELRVELGISEKDKVVGIVAGLRPMKHHKTFLSAAKLVSMEMPNVCFVIVGDGPLRQELENYAGELGIGEKVIFMGWRKDISAVLRVFDVGVNCSANEGLSNAIMEYMASGISSVVSRAGGNEELIEHGVNGYTFQLDNGRELAGYITRLLEDGRKREKFSVRSREIVKTRLGLMRMIKEYEIFFDQMG